MPSVSITESGCRGCTLCVDVCPVDVFEVDDRGTLAKVVAGEDCIGCLSCIYACPSQCITVSDVHLIRPFHRIEENVALVEQFLQTQAAADLLTGDELNQAYHEVGILLAAFAEAITEILGRGHKSVGRRAGTVAAAHLPEMYEETELDDLLKHMNLRFGSSFDFEYTITDRTDISLCVQPCGLLQAIRTAGEKPGESVICLLFHEYWAALVSSFTGAKYSYQVQEAGEKCCMKLQPIG
jgi:NAD-dependent dihydropyrimidine dehydrogenase PreA subunit